MMRMEKLETLNAKDLMKRVGKHNLAHLKFSKEELMDALNYYKQLSIIFLDSDENITFL
jgi:hypothetical protein